jgi:site-specific recombinase XerD
MNLYQSGCPLSYIQQMLGHNNISTTSGFYAFATLNTLAKALEKANPSSSDKKMWKDKTVSEKLYR